MISEPIARTLTDALKGRIDELQEKILVDERLRNAQAQAYHNNMFPNMGSTDSLRWQAQIDVLKEYLEFLEAEINAENECEDLG